MPFTLKDSFSFASQVHSTVAVAASNAEAERSPPPWAACTERLADAWAGKVATAPVSVVDEELPPHELNIKPAAAAPAMRMAGRTARRRSPAGLGAHVGLGLSSLMRSPSFELQPGKGLAHIEKRCPT
ncbi:hypothetical protein GCM10009107_13740 [Ideonella azotifigens]|uniref:Uncharacterized protein n=1 Tax=Ideonella azotifigens TaxID=513160 RepID=A0ABN1JTM0_9BURK